MVDEGAAAVQPTFSGVQDQDPDGPTSVHQVGRLARWLDIAAGAVVAVLSILPGLAYLAGRLDGGYLADADHMLLQELIPDLTSGGSVSDWTIPYATYMIPDWPLYAASLALGPTPATSIAIFATMQIALMAVATRMLAGEFDGDTPWVTALAGFAVVVIGILWNGGPLVYLAASYVHGGTAIFSVMTLALLLRWVRTGTWPSLIAGGLVTFCAVASDRLFVIWALVPAFVTIGTLLLMRRTEWRVQLQWLAVNLGAAILALPVAGLLFSERSEYDLRLGFQPILGLRHFGQSLQLVHELSPLIIPAAVVATLLSISLIAAGRSLTGTQFSPELRIGVAVYCGIVAMGIVASQIAMVGGVLPHFRYSTPMFLLPLVVAPMLALPGLPTAIASLTPAKLVGAGALGSALLLIGGSTKTWAGRVNPNLQSRPVSCVENALARDEPAHGISSYWDARPFQVYSKGSLVMSEFGPDLFPMPVNANRAEYIGDYDFAILHDPLGPTDLLPQRLEALAGPPLRRTACGPWTVYDYGPRGLNLAPFDEVGAERVFDGCMLRTQNGIVTPQCTLSLEPASPAGYFVFGPYAPAPPGEYEFTVQYSSQGPEDHVVGTWDITRDGPGELAVAEGKLFGTNGAPDTFRDRIRVAMTEPEIRLQWRLFTEPGAAATVQSVTIRRLR